MSAPTDPGAPDDDEFFVGYLPTPPRTRRFALGAGAAAIALVALSGVAIAGTMTSPGSGVTPFHGPEHFVGVLSAHPYGVLWTLSDDERSLRAILIVRGGKLGMPPQAATLDGAVVAIDGGLLDRDGHRMIELAHLPEASTELDAARVARIRALLAEPPETLGEVELRGEIVDSKCYLGRMRPGGGRTHRACAQLCVAGGIPPVLVTRDHASGTEQHYLLVRADAEPAELGRAVLPYLAEPVALRGRLERRGDLLVLAIDPATIRRL